MKSQLYDIYTCMCIGVEDFVPNHILWQTEQLFNEEPYIVDPLYKLTADAILSILGKSAPTNFYEGLEAYFILVAAFSNH